MRFKNFTFEISGIKEVRIDGELYTRQTHTTTTSGGRRITNKFFRREKDGYMIHEHKFVKKITNMNNRFQTQSVTCAVVNDYGDVVNKTYNHIVNEWRFWFSGETLNIEHILV